MWSRKEFLSSGFSMQDLIPVRHAMRAANRAPIKIDGAVLIRLSGLTAAGSHLEAAAMVYISPDANAFFLSKDAMIQLGIISSSFPQIGSTSATESANIGACKLSEPEDPGDTMNSTADACGCRRRSLPPGKPERLPFECTSKNTDKMKSWLIERYASSTFNQCPHQVLPSMEGPPISLHVADDSKPVKATTPSTVPLYWQEKVKQDLNRDVRLGVLE